MKPALVSALGLALLLAACGSSDQPAEKAGADASRDAGSHAKSKSVAISIDSEKGEYDLKLPGGLGGSLKLPAGLMDKADFEVNGVKPYPGAKVQTVNVNATETAGTKRSNVVIRFLAPADPVTVADWYQQAFTAKGATVTRTGTSLSGTTDDNDAFTITLAANGKGTDGTLTISESKPAG